MNEKTLVKKFDVSKILRTYGILLVLVVLCAVVSLLTDKFLTSSNILSVARQVSSNGILALGLGFVILTGGIDLSVGSLLALTSTIGYSASLNGIPFIPALLIGVAVGVVVGLLEGLLVARVRIAPFIATLASMTICRGATQVYDRGTAVNVEEVLFRKIGTGYLGAIPTPVIILFVAFIIGGIILKKTKFGRYVYAVGGNEQASKLAGVPTERVKIAVYAISGVCCAVSGYITAGRLGSATPTAGQGAEMDAIAAVVLGGVSMDGGKGTIFGVLVGAFIIGVLNNSLNLLGVSSYWQDIAKGIVILLAVIMDRYMSTNSKK